MQEINCPSCGAPAAFRSSAAVMVVCEFCHSTLLKDADTVKDIGKMSTVLEDYTPLQIHTSGQWDGQGFTLVGRIQLRPLGGRDRRGSRQARGRRRRDNRRPEAGRDGRSASSRAA